MIDNLVQIGHNVVLGRGCVLAGQVGISGSTQARRFCHGRRAGRARRPSATSAAARGSPRKSGVMRDVPAGETVCGSPGGPDGRVHEAGGDAAASCEEEGRSDDRSGLRRTQQALPEIDIQRIMEMIPHRHPFLMIDKVVDVVANERATGIKNVSINEHYFQGHFPARPVMPGVLIIEAMAQTAAVLVVHTLGPEAEGKLVYFMSVDNARFRRPVLPGDRLARPCHQAAQSRQCLEVRGPGQGRRQI